MNMGLSFKNLFKKDKPQEDTEHVSLEKSTESDSAKTEARAKHKKGEVVIADAALWRYSDEYSSVICYGSIPDCSISQEAR